MEKKLVSFRLTEEAISKLKDVSSKLNISDTEAIARAINVIYAQVKQEEQAMINGSLISLSEYQKAQEQIKQLIYRVGELEGVNKEKERTIEEVKEHLNTVKEQLDKAQSEISKSKKGFFDRLFRR